MNVNKILSRRASVASKTDMVSILIPSYQRELYLQDSLISALSQTYENLDIVICDDGSTDNTLNLVKDVCSNDPRVRIYQQKENVGFKDNMKTLLSLAMGSYIKFLGSDDTLNSNAVEILTYVLKNNSNVSIATSAREFINSNNASLGMAPLGPLNSTIDTVFDAISIGRAMLVDHVNWIGELTTAMFRQSDLNADEFATYGGRSFSWISDVSTWFTLLEKGAVGFTPRTLSSCRIHPGQEGIRNLTIRTSNWIDLVEGSIPKYLACWKDISLALAKTSAELLPDLVLEESFENRSAYGNHLSRISKLLVEKVTT